MADTITVVLPYSGSRYYLQVPTSGLLDKVDFKLWGAGGGAGGTDSHSGGNGAGGGFVQGTTQITKGATLEVFVGQGGAGGGNSSGGGQGPSGKSLASYAGGIGGAAGPAGSSGGGGGGGGASVIRINNSVVAVAGGGGAGGGGGNRGPYPYGYSATGLPSGSQSTQVYPNGGTNGAWSWLLNTYSVWQGNGNYTWSVYFPATQNYQFDLAVDNYGWLYVDDVEIVHAPSYNSVWSATQTISAGWHTVRVYGINTGGPGAIGARILQNGSAIWTTRSEIGAATHGFNGGNCGSDGGGGGAGGGGFYGGAGGTQNPYYDNGGYAGANGANYFGNVNPLSTGQYANARTPGGSTDPNYPGSNVGYGGIANSGAGGNGYAILTFYKAAGFHVNDQGVYRRVVPKIKIAGTYTNNAKAWVKVDGVWRSVLADPAISFSSDSTGWGS